MCFSFARLHYVFSKKERRNKCYLSEFSGIKMIEKVRRHDLWSQLWFCGCLLPFTISFSVFTLNWSFAIRASTKKSSVISDIKLMYLRERMKKYSAQSINFYWPPTKHTDTASVAYLTLIGMRQGGFTPLTIFGLDFVGWIFIKNFQTFFGGENWYQLG